MRRSFYAGIRDEDGRLRLLPLRHYLRNIERISGLDPNRFTSEQLRRKLRKMGWAELEDDAKVVLIKPWM